MDAETLDGHVGTSVTIDLCLPCQVFWFDTRESLKLSPGAVLKLFGIIGEQLSAQQIDELRRNVQFVNCSNCGAPVDLTTHSSCAHCGSPLSMLDLKQAGVLIAELREADHAARGIDPSLPLDLARARHEVDAAFASFQHGPNWFDDVSQGGIVAAGLSSLARWLKQQG